MLAFLIVFTAVSMVFWTMVIVALGENHEKEPKLHALSYPPAPDDAPLVSVIIPARNEEENIPPCLEAVLAQDYRRFEVIVVDDRSEDRTAEAVQRFVERDDRVRLLRGKTLPEGWAGKCHAIDQGVRAARGEWLLMLDTDTFLAPRCLSATVQDALAQKVDLYTLIFEARCESFWEKVVQPLFFQFIFMSLPVHRLNDPERAEAAAPGPFLLFRRSAYEAIGGHAGMKDEVVEDMRLAQRIKEKGFRLYVANAVSLMYCRRRIGLKEIWHGWSRVFYTGLDKSPWKALLAFASMGLFLLLPWVAPFYAAGSMLFGGVPFFYPLVLLLVGVAHCLVFVAIRKQFRIFYRLDDSMTWLQPVAVVIAMAVVVNSMLVSIRSSSVVWRGRSY